MHMIIIVFQIINHDFVIWQTIVTHNHLRTQYYHTQYQRYQIKRTNHDQLRLRYETDWKPKFPKRVLSICRNPKVGNRKKSAEYTRYTKNDRKEFGRWRRHTKSWGSFQGTQGHIMQQSRLQFYWQNIHAIS